MSRLQGHIDLSPAPFAPLGIHVELSVTVWVVESIVHPPLDPFIPALKHLQVLVQLPDVLLMLGCPKVVLSLYVGRDVLRLLQDFLAFLYSGLQWELGLGLGVGLGLGLGVGLGLALCYSGLIVFNIMKHLGQESEHDHLLPLQCRLFF